MEVKEQITRQILEQVLDRARQSGATSAEVYALESQSTPIEFENNRLKSIQAKVTRGLALRVIRKGRLGFASSTDLTRLDDLVTAAVQAAEIGELVEYEFARSPSIVIPETEASFPTPEAQISQGEELIARLHQVNPDILASATLNTQSRTVQVATTEDVFLRRRDRYSSTMLSGNLVRGEDFLEIYDFAVEGDRAPDGEFLLQRLREKFRNAQRRATISSGSYPVLFVPRAVSSTFGRLFKTLLSGQSVVQKASPLTDKIGQTLFDSRFTLYEDPAIGVAACPFDDEATPTEPKTLIEAGTVQQFYWDRRWAARGSQSPSGNGFRSGLSRPSPSLVNLCIAPGTLSLAHAIASLKEGLIVEQVLGAGQSNQLAGEFSVNLDLGYKVENGEIVGRVKNVMVAGSVFEAFKNLVDLSDECQWVGTNAYLPALLFANLGVAARA